MKGWIKLHRKILDWEYFNDCNTLSVYIYLLVTASSEQTTYKGLTIDVGCVAKSIADIAYSTGLTTSQVRTSIKKLKIANNIASKSTNKITIYKVLNYSTYQHKDNPKQQTNQQTNQQQNSKPSEREYNNYNNNYYKEYKEERKGKAPTLEEVQEYIRLKQYNINADKFMAYYTSIDWRGVKDWKAKADYWQLTERPPQQTKPNAFTNYTQKQYTDEEIEEIIARKNKR